MAQLLDGCDIKEAVCGRILAIFRQKEEIFEILAVRGLRSEELYIFKYLFVGVACLFVEYLSHEVGDFGGSLQ